MHTKTVDVCLFDQNKMFNDNYMESFKRFLKHD